MVSQVHRLATVALLVLAVGTLGAVAADVGATHSNDITTSANTTSADFQVTDLTAPPSVDQGDDISAAATITNDGTTQGTQTVEFRAAGTVLGSTNVTLDAGESQDVSFTANTAGLPVGTITHGVYTEDDNQTADLTIVAEVPDDADAFLDSGTNFWIGQTLYFQAPAPDASQDYALYQTDGDQVGGFVAELTLSSSADRFIDTSRHAITQEEYVILNDDGDPVVFNADGNVERTIPRGQDVSPAAFAIRSQTFNTAIQSSEVTEGNETTVNLDSNRGGYAVNVSSGSLDDSETDAVFPASDGVTLSDVANNEDFTLDTSTLDPGTYQFEFSVTDAVPTDNVTLNVTKGRVTVPGASDPAKDIDGDGVLEDVNGDGSFTPADVTMLFTNRNSAAVQGNQTLFDFNGDGRFTPADVNVMFSNQST